MVGKFTIFYNNIRSVSANLGHLEILVSELKPSVIALTETWFKSENDDELFSLEGYHQPFTSTRTILKNFQFFQIISTDSEKRKIQYKQQLFYGNKYKQIGKPK